MASLLPRFHSHRLANGMTLFALFVLAALLLAPATSRAQHAETSSDSLASAPDSAASAAANAPAPPPAAPPAVPAHAEASPAPMNAHEPEPMVPHAAEPVPVIPRTPVTREPSAHNAATSPEPQSPAPSAPGPGIAFSPPANLDDLGAWLEYRSHNHIASLPQEARVYYRRGLLLAQSGSLEDAIRLVRGASELDPEFVAPHLTLASWFLMREPSQALQQYAAVLELARQNFVLQLSLVANVIYLLIQALFLGLLAAALIIVWLHNAELRHAWQEALAGFIAAPGARLWAWSFLVLPFLVGFGAALPALVFLGLLWPMLKIRERTVFIMFVTVLVGAPWITGMLDRLSAPLRSDEAPLFAVPTLAGEPYTPERQQELVALAADHPNDAFAQFALGWIARRGGDLPLAEKAYRRALELWPANDRVMNNLGNTLAIEGRADDALALYEKAYAADRRNAGAYFNASQIFTQRFEYRAANEALSRASALNFDLVKSYQSQATEDGLLPLIDQWLAPRTFWSSLSLLAPAGARREMLPPGWRGHLECSGWGFSAAALLLAVVSLVMGHLQHHRMPLRACSNCDRILCRKCAARRREIALCSDCAAVQAQAESPEFARVLLMQRRRGVQKGRHLLRTALASLVPGYGMMALDRAFLPLVLLCGTGALLSGWLGLRTPFFYEPRVLQTGSDLPVALCIALWAIIYGVSLLSYFLARPGYDARAAAASLAGQARTDKAARRVTAAAA
jgi:tetratricopeptide (TPR) repeat protein